MLTELKEGLGITVEWVLGCQKMVNLNNFKTVFYIIKIFKNTKV